MGYKFFVFLLPIRLYIDKRKHTHAATWSCFMHARVFCATHRAMHASYLYVAARAVQ